MEVAGTRGDPGDPWTNDPGPLITPVDAGAVYPSSPFDHQAMFAIPKNWSKSENPALEISPLGLSREAEQMPCVKLPLHFCLLGFDQQFLRTDRKFLEFARQQYLSIFVYQLN